VRPFRRRREEVATVSPSSPESCIVSFEVEHHGDAGEVHSLVHELGNAAEPVQVVVAVTPGAPLGACRFEQPALLVEPQALRR
jgi:hypothetical protein